MKKILLLISFVIITFLAKAQKVQDKNSKQIVEASCGQCNFGMEGKSCDLAVKINGKAYFVEGTKIDDHGDAHAKDGFCMAIKKAEVKGEIVGGKFIATYFKLLDLPKK